MASGGLAMEPDAESHFASELCELRNSANSQFDRLSAQLMSVTKDLNEMKGMVAQLLQGNCRPTTHIKLCEPEPAGFTTQQDMLRTCPTTTSWSEAPKSAEWTVKRSAKSVLHKEASAKDVQNEIARACANIQKIAYSSAHKHKKLDIAEVVNGIRKRKQGGEHQKEEDTAEAGMQLELSPDELPCPSPRSHHHESAKSAQSSFEITFSNGSGEQDHCLLPAAHVSHLGILSKASSLGPQIQPSLEKQSITASKRRAVTEATATFTNTALDSKRHDGSLIDDMIDAHDIGAEERQSSGHLTCNNPFWDPNTTFPGSILSETEVKPSASVHSGAVETEGVSTSMMDGGDDAIVSLAHRENLLTTTSTVQMEAPPLKGDVEAVFRPPSEESGSPPSSSGRRTSLGLVWPRLWFSIRHWPHNLVATAKVLSIDVMLHDGSYRTAWDLATLLMLAFVCVVIPYIICFDIDTSDISRGIGLANFILNLLFLIDIYLNFRTSFPGENGEHVVSHAAIASNYLKGWFTIDVLSSIPWDLLASSSAVAVFKILKTVRVVRLSRVIKVVSVVKMFRMLKVAGLGRKLGKVLGSTFVRLLTFIMGALLLIHWNACAFYLASTFTGRASDTWVGKAGLSSDPLIKRYIFSLYWAVTTMTTVGYGDITPISLFEKMFCMFSMLLGASLFAYLMGSMSTIMATHNAVAARMARKKQAVDDFLTHRKLPTHLADRVHNFYEYVVEREVHGDEADIISGLSNALRTDVILHLYKEALEKVPFFRGKHPQFITSLVTHLKLEFYAPGDVVVQQGDVGAEMYFIGEGNLQVRLYKDPRSVTSFTHDVAVARQGVDKLRTPLDRLKARLLAWYRREKELEVVMPHPAYRVVGHMGKGQYFGEVACLTGTTRLATVVALDFCELYSLTRSNLESVIERWPSLATEFEMLVKEYKNEEPAASTQRASSPSSTTVVELGQRRQHASTSSIPATFPEDADEIYDPYWKFKEVAEKKTRLSVDMDGPSGSVRTSRTGSVEVVAGGGRFKRPSKTYPTIMSTPAHDG